MNNDWVYDENGNKLEFNNQPVDAYFNSDKNGKDYKIGKLFGYVQLLTEQLNRNTVEINQLKQRIQRLESENK